MDREFSSAVRTLAGAVPGPGHKPAGPVGRSSAGRRLAGPGAGPGRRLVGRMVVVAVAGRSRLVDRSPVGRNLVGLLGAGLGRSLVGCRGRTLLLLFL